MKMIELEGNRYVRADLIECIWADGISVEVRIEGMNMHSTARTCPTEHEAEIEARRLAKELSKAASR